MSSAHKFKLLFIFFLLFFALCTSNTFAQTCNTGDGDGNGKVDGFDYVIWWQHFNQNITGVENGDFDCNGKVDGFDYVIWWQNFGTTVNVTPTPTPTGPTPTPGGQIKITYNATNEDFANPERGFMMNSSVWVDQPFSSSKVGRKDASDSVVWIYFRLDNYRDSRDGVGVKLCADLENCTSSEYHGKLLESLGSGKGLDTVKATFDAARSKGLKLVIRLIYNPGPGSSKDPLQVNPDVPLTVAQQHIDQLKPLFVANSDVIAAVQIGFLGHWGEWHSSKYMNSLNTKNALIDSLLQAVPKERMLQMRYPRYKQLFYGGPVTQSNGFNQSSVSRIGLYDDAFLKDDTDDGTFKSNSAGVKITNYCDNYSGTDAACWRDYINKDSRFTPTSGEAGTHSSTPSSYADCSNALVQLANMHWSMLHNGYSKVVLDHWVAQGCMPEIRRRLGYRIVLKDAYIAETVQHGSSMNLKVNLENTGFASMYNPRTVYAVIYNNSNRYNISLGSVDPRTWEAGKSSSFDVNVNVPSGVVAGVYKLGLWLPDASTSLRNNPAYSVKFANNNVWDSTNGINILTSNLVVK